MMGGTLIAGAPQAQAQACGAYPLPSQGAASKPATFTLVVAGGVTCEQDHGIFDDWFAGKGVKTARNASTDDGWNCVANPAGVYDETGVLSWCESSPNRIEIRK